MVKSEQRSKRLKYLQCIEHELGFAESVLLFLFIFALSAWKFVYRFIYLFQQLFRIECDGSEIPNERFNWLTNAQRSPNTNHRKSQK